MTSKNDTQWKMVTLDRVSTHLTTCPINNSPYSYSYLTIVDFKSVKNGLYTPFDCNCDTKDKLQSTIIKIKSTIIKTLVRGDQIYLDSTASQHITKTCKIGPRSIMTLNKSSYINNPISVEGCMCGNLPALDHIKGAHLMSIGGYILSNGRNKVPIHYTEWDNYIAIKKKKQSKEIDFLDLVIR